jgi:hypothetical protein
MSTTGPAYYGGRLDDLDWSRLGMSPRLDTATKTEVVSVAATAFARGQASWFRGELSPLLDYVADFPGATWRTAREAAGLNTCGPAVATRA